MYTATNFFLVLALFAFLFASLRLIIDRIDSVALGLFFCMLAFLIARIQG